MNEKTKTTNGATRLFRVNYQYAARNGQLRAGSLIIEATNIEEAQKVATERLPTFGHTHHRVTGAKEY